MNKKPKISVLVPCYNVEKFLVQCMDSIVNQTLRDIEIICINDGSTDSTLDILKSYADKDKRVLIIDKPNEGYGKSMNRGLDKATGKYIGIVESDDWIDADMFENLVAAADENDVDVVKSNFYEYTTTDGEKNILNDIVPVHEAGRVIEPRLENGILWAPPSIWAAIYNREFLIKNNIRFLESPGASFQDTGFNFKVWLMANRAYLTTNAYLHYRCDNVNSSVKSTAKVFCVCDEWDEIERYIAQEQPQMYEGTRRLISVIKWGTYEWNLDRLCGDVRRDFQERFTREYEAHIRAGHFTRALFDDREWARRLCVIYPKSVLVRLQRVFFNLIRPIYRTDIIGGKKYFRLFKKINIRSPKNMPSLEVVVR